MHTVEVALNMLRIGHLVRCEIRPSKREGKTYNIITIAQDGQGGEHYEVTDEGNRVCNYVGLNYAKQIALQIGFSSEKINVIED